MPPPRDARLVLAATGRSAPPLLPPLRRRLDSSRSAQSTTAEAMVSMTFRLLKLDPRAWPVRLGQEMVWHLDRTKLDCLFFDLSCFFASLRNGFRSQKFGSPPINKHTAGETGFASEIITEHRYAHLTPCLTVFPLAPRRRCTGPHLLSNALAHWDTGSDYVESSMIFSFSIDFPFSVTFLLFLLPANRTVARAVVQTDQRNMTTSSSWTRLRLNNRRSNGPPDGRMLWHDGETGVRAVGLLTGAWLLPTQTSVCPPCLSGYM
ncbi:hypothetical protein IWX49DRAFT_53070 [Phyllosticta citricarpa]|uniref:Uncharacterized protein n=2 Tax=Phyllosticta TaxID=121621 RepID=A0ABR1MPM4_9PEZI